MRSKENIREVTIIGDKMNALCMLLTGLLLTIQVGINAQAPVPESRLWYSQPAERWMRHALPIGNGSIGAMIFGGVEVDRIQFNEKTVWSGAKNDNANNTLKKAMPTIQHLLADGKIEAADSLFNISRTSENEITTRENFGSYQPFGDIILKFKSYTGKIENYRRELDIAKAVATVVYKQNGVNYKRSYFCSYPDKVMVLHLSADKPGKLSVDISTVMPHSSTARIDVDQNNDIVMRGAMQESGLQYCAMLRINAEGGNVAAGRESIVVENATKITLVLSAATNYQMKWAQLINKVDPAKICSNRLNDLRGLNYIKLYNSHVKDYSALFSNVCLDLPTVPERAQLPTDERIRRYTLSNQQGRENGGDPGLEALLFHYGRYLMISSSRGNTLPANLQGIWNDSSTPPWDSDYHTDINLEMNYWPNGPVNLDECFSPFLRYMKFLQQAGSRPAKEYFNARGFFIHIYTNPWGYAAPRWLWTGAAGWLCQNLYDHFAFSGNIHYLKNDALPIMKEACRFYLDNLFFGYDGRLSVVPSNSPEVNFLYKNGKDFRYSAGAAIDQQIVFNLFSNTIEAIDVVQADFALGDSLRAALSKLAAPVQISSSGNIREWKEDWRAVDTSHRHISHLYALFPGKFIDPGTQPAFANAAARTLEERGKGTGWSLVWRMLCWTRLQKPERAYGLFKNFICQSTNEQVDYFGKPGSAGIYENLFAAHSPFQIDANFGYTAAVAEMLLQSHHGGWRQGYTIHLLPALPKAWQHGKVKGLRARGGFVLDLEWKAGQLEKAVITSNESKSIKILYKGKITELEIEKGKSLQLNGELNELK